MIESEYLKEDIQNIQKLMTIPPLRKIETEHLRQLLRLSKIKEYEPGEIIIRQGDADPWIYFLLSGTVRVERDGIHIGVMDKIGEIFGEMRILDGLARSASVSAETTVVCLAVNTSVASDRLTTDERAEILLLLYRIFMEFIAIRLRLANEELVAARKEINRLKEEYV